MHYFWSNQLVVFIIISLSLNLLACGDRFTENQKWEATPTALQTNPPAEEHYQTNVPANRNHTKKVNVMDRSLNMPIVNFEVPSDYRVVHDIATNVNNGSFQKYVFEIHSGEGDKVSYVMPGLDFAAYHDPYTGIRNDNGLGQLLYAVMSDYASRNNIKFYQNGLKEVPIPSDERKLQELAQQYRSQGLMLRSFEWEFSGVQTKGKAAFVIIDMTNKIGGMYTEVGQLMIGAIVEAAPNRFTGFEKAIKNLNMDFNPNWSKTRAQISQRNSQQMAASRQQMAANHQQRMASNNAAFRAQQDAHRQTQAAYQASNDAWYDRNLGSGSNYNSTAAFNDAMTEHTSFDDPHTGFQVKQEGFHDYWYTDGQGEYYGTDDAFFDPSSLQGNWQSIQPLSPTGNY